MADFKPRPGTFLPFLESTNRETPVVSRGTGTPLTLLDILSRQTQRSLPIFDLQSLSGLDALRYGDALKSLIDAKFVVIEGEPNDQLVRLTESGTAVVRLARPA